MFLDPEQLQRRQDEIDNTVLVVFFLAMLGATAQLNINIIYDAVIVCLSTAVLIWARRPGLRWKIVGGALTFTVLYTVVLTVTHAFYPDFFNYWKLDQLSHIFIFRAPLEEYMFAFSFGAFWSPLYEAWKHERLKRTGQPVAPAEHPPLARFRESRRDSPQKLGKGNAEKHNGSRRRSSGT